MRPRGDFRSSRHFTMNTPGLCRSPSLYCWPLVFLLFLRPGDGDVHRVQRCFRITARLTCLDAPQTKDIMLRIYSSINEPDSISSISLLCREPLAQLQVNQHREDWASTLSVADRALQAASLQLQPTEPLQTRPEDLWDHIVRSLSGLGCMEAANAVLQQRVAQRDISARDAGRLRERWYESAWRAGQWGQVGGEKLAHDPLGSFQVSRHNRLIQRA